MLKRIRSFALAMGAIGEDKPLLYHVQNNDDVSHIARMLSKGYSANVNDTGGRTPLMIAAGNGNALVVDALLSHGANLNACDRSGNTALHYAAEARATHFRTIRKRFYANEKGGGSRVPQDADFELTLRALCDKAKSGSGIDPVNREGETPLMYAVGYPAHVAALLRYSPALSILSKSGRTALEQAIDKGMSECARLLQLTEAGQ